MAVQLLVATCCTLSKTRSAEGWGGCSVVGSYILHVVKDSRSAEGWGGCSVVGSYILRVVKD